ncbi:MAG: hypothetical protein N3G21_06725 [Candidatus Hydrogenedentes bacterium]|nr:hypothetical protein [Candidatus Hydrogenedentota bacterium]
MNKLYLFNPPIFFTLFLTIVLITHHIDSFAQLPNNTNIEKVNSAKEKILKFIKENKHNFRVVDLILLDFIQRRFNLPREFCFEESFTRIPKEEDIQALKIYGKLVGYKGIESQKPQKAEPFTWSVIDAIFIENEKDCPSKEYILDRLKSQLNGKGYEITHTALAFGLYIERRCLYISDPDVKELHTKICNSLQQLSRSIPEPTDLKLEALCFASYLECRERINPTDIDMLLNLQRVDGAFSGTLNPNAGINVHTTLLGLWLICEFSSQLPIPKTNMIRK